MFADKEISICLWDLKEFQYGFGLHSLVLSFKLIYKPQVEESKREDLYPNALTQEQFNYYFIEWALLVPFITFEQVLENLSSLKKASEVSISWYLQL